MSDNVKNHVLTIAGLDKDKLFIKFNEEYTEYIQIAENVKPFLDRFEVGQTVKVLIQDGEKVVCIKETLNKPKVEKKETSANIETKENLTVGGISKYSGVVFKEEKGVWYSFKKLGTDSFQRGDVISFRYEKKKGNPVVEILGEVKKEEPKVEAGSTVDAPKDEAERAKKHDSKTTNSSIEMQVSLKESGAIIRKMMDQGASYDEELYLSIAKAGMKFFRGE
jgi:hypothetical protein